MHVIDRSARSSMGFSCWCHKLMVSTLQPSTKRLQCCPHNQTDSEIVNGSSETWSNAKTNGKTMVSNQTTNYDFILPADQINCEHSSRMGVGRIFPGGSIVDFFRGSQKDFSR